ncbi:MAG: YceI family protein [Gemmobacter sp.]
MIRALCLVATLLSPLPLAAQDLPPPEAGAFRLDLGHTRVLFRVSHLGFSMYTGFFRDVDATLAFDPENPAAMQVTATIQVGSVETMYPDPALDFNAVLAGADLLDAAQYPEMTFTSTAVTLTGENSADVTGDLTLHGVARPVTLAVTYNGGYGHFPMDPGGARIGFSATGAINRSDFGMGYGVPAPGSEFGVGDRVEIVIETEFTNPDAAKP